MLSLTRYIMEEEGGKGKGRGNDKGRKEQMTTRLRPVARQIK